MPSPSHGSLHHSRALEFQVQSSCQSKLTKHILSVSTAFLMICPCPQNFKPVSLNQASKAAPHLSFQYDQSELYVFIIDHVYFDATLRRITCKSQSLDSLLKWKCVSDERVQTHDTTNNSGNPSWPRIAIPVDELQLFLCTLSKS